MTVIDALVDVMEASFDPHYREAWTRRQVEDSLVLSATFVMLVGADGSIEPEPAGAAGFILARQAADEVELLLIAVRPEHRGKGLGRVLLEEFVIAARKRGAVQVFLEMRDNNPAERLYRSAGFDRIGRRKDYYRTVTGHPLDAITFGRPV